MISWDDLVVRSGPSELRFFGWNLAGVQTKKFVPQPNSPPKISFFAGQIWPPDHPVKLGSWAIEDPNWVYLPLKLQVHRVIWSPDTNGDIWLGYKPKSLYPSQIPPQKSRFALAISGHQITLSNWGLGRSKTLTGSTLPQNLRFRG